MDKRLIATALVLLVVQLLLAAGASWVVIYVAVKTLMALGVIQMGALCTFVPMLASAVIAMMADSTISGVTFYTRRSPRVVQ